MRFVFFASRGITIVAGLKPQGVTIDAGGGITIHGFRFPIHGFLRSNSLVLRSKSWLSSCNSLFVLQLMNFVFQPMASSLQSSSQRFPKSRAGSGYPDWPMSFSPRTLLYRCPLL